MNSFDFCNQGEHDFELSSLNNGLLMVPTPIVFCHKCPFYYIPEVTDGQVEDEEEGGSTEEEDASATCGCSQTGTYVVSGKEVGTVRISLE